MESKSVVISGKDWRISSSEEPIGKGYWKAGMYNGHPAVLWYHSREDEQRSLYHLVAGMEECTCAVRCPHYIKYAGADA